MVKTPPEVLLQKRMKHLPVAIDRTLGKLESLLSESAEYRMPVEDDWKWRWEALHSRFLTDTKLIDAEWERTIKHARHHNTR